MQGKLEEHIATSLRSVRASVEPRGTSEGGLSTPLGFTARDEVEPVETPRPRETRR